jgi:nucleoside-diphosphate-sugar epimerase
MPQTVLLTGANGFVGSHILALLLSAHNTVHAVVRTQAKAAQVQSDFPAYTSPQLTFSIVPDITSPGAFNDAITSAEFDAVIHTASPFLYRAVSSNMEFLDPAIKGTVGILRSAKALAPSLKRVIITSSCAAVVDFNAPVSQQPPKVYGDDDWNPRTWEEAVNGTPNMGYQASKKFAEKAGKYS